MEHELDNLQEPDIDPQPDFPEPDDEYYTANIPEPDFPESDDEYYAQLAEDAEEYYAHLAEVQHAEEQAIQAGSRTQEYLTFKQAVRTTQYTVRFMARPYARKRQELPARHSELKAQAAASEDRVARLGFEYGADTALEELALLEYAYHFVAQAQRQVFTAHLINTLENYLIDVTKKLLITYPGSLKGQLPHELLTQVTYSDIKNLLGQPGEIQSYMLTRLISGGERDYTLRSVLKILSGLKHKVSLHREDIEALNRAVAVRHKLTHRAGKIDAQFLQEVALPIDKKTGLPIIPTRYTNVGTTSLQIGETYQVSEEELNQVIELVSNIALAVEIVMTQHYPDVLTLEPWDLLIAA